MEKSFLQARWFHKQGLDDPDSKLSCAQVLEKSGWCRTVGGSNAYVTLFSRARIGREQADKDAANAEIHELPSARGCTYMLPKSEYELGLLVGTGFSEEAAMNTARKFLGVTDAEVDRLMERILEALAKGPLDPKDMKDAVGDAVRNLGEEGKKRGQTTTLSLGLGKLQTAGRIRRIPANGRLDQQRYSYGLWSPSPLDGIKMSREEAFEKLARRYFEWIGPATAQHFQWFSGLGVKATKDSLASLNLVPMEEGSDYLILPEEFDVFQSFKPSREPIYALVNAIDAISMLTRDLPMLLADEDMHRHMMSDGGLREMGSVQDLTNNAILDRGRVIGIWEYEPASSSIVWFSFVPKNKDLEAAVARTEAFIRDQLGDSRSFSLDSPESRKPKIEAIRSMK